MNKKIMSDNENNGDIVALMHKIENSKKQYEQVIDAIQDNICVINNNSEIISCNKAFAKNINLPIKKISGLLCSSILPCFKDNLFSSHCALAEKGGVCLAKKVFTDKKALTFIQQFTDKSKQTHYYRFTVFPIKNETDVVNKIVMVIRDITNNKIAENKITELNKNLEKKVEKRAQQLDKAYKELKEVLELKSKFISDASHELRTPLTIIQGNVDLEVQELRIKNKKIPEFYDIVQKELTIMTGILNDLTSLSNFDTKTEKIEQDIVSLNMITKSTVRSLDVLAKQKNIKLELVKNGQNINIIGDEQKLEKLLLNITRNAIKYTDIGGHIKVYLEKDDKTAKIIVEDDGIGIPKSDLPYIFERFYRVDKARSRQEGGTGLGLSICKYIAEAHNGNIKVESEEGKGSKFTLELPINL